MSSFLQNYQRQPKLFIDLPSKGKFYDDTVLENGQYVQIPVFGMNAMDEIMFKTPDALFSGEATAQVIRSCIPTILDPWQLVGYDIDFILIALRIATYGDGMSVNTLCPHCSTDTESVISLSKLLDGFNNYETDFKFKVGELIFSLAPITYKETTNFSIEHYQYDRELYQVLSLKDETEEEKDKRAKSVYAKTAKLNLRLAISHIESVSNGHEEESDPNVISEFINNNDAEFFAKLREGITDLTSKWNLPQFTIKCSNEECTKEYKAAINVDYSNFFGVSSLRSRNLI